jgi:SecY translocase
MTYCPNPDCEHRKLTGKPAEFRSDLDRCNECGSELVHDDPTPSREPRRSWPRSLERRVGVTFLIGGALLAAFWLPSPFLDLVPSVSMSDNSLEETMRPLSLGVRPFIVAFVLVELVALIIPAIRRLRLTSVIVRKRLWLAALITGVCLALFQSYGIATYLEALPTLEPGFKPFVPLFCLTLTLGTVLFAVAARLIDRFGVGAGFGVVLAVSIVGEICYSLSGAVEMFLLGLVTVFSLLLESALIVGLIFGIHHFFRMGDRLTKDRSFTLPTCGTLPLDVGLKLAMLLATLSAFFLLTPLETMSSMLVSGTIWNTVFVTAVVVAITMPATALFYWRKRRSFATGPHRKQWRRARLLSGAFLIALVIVDNLARAHAHHLWLFPDVWVLVIFYALVADWLAEIGIHRHRDAREPSVVGEYQDVSDALAAMNICRESSPEESFVVTGLRFRSFSYFLAPYVPMRLIATNPVPAPETADSTDEEKRALRFTAADAISPHDPKDKDPYLPPHNL